MIKQLILVIAFSVVGIIFKTELVHVLDGLVLIHNYIARTLHMIFSDDKVGLLIQDIVSLLVIPLVVGVLVALVFWLVKHTAMPHTMAVVWVLWLILFITMLAQNHISPSGAQSASRASQRAG